MASRETTLLVVHLQLKNCIDYSQKLFMTDSEVSFSKKIGWTKGERTGRYAIIIDHGKVVYAEKEPGGDVTVSFKQ